MKAFQTTLEQAAMFGEADADPQKLHTAKGLGRWASVDGYVANAYSKAAARAQVSGFDGRPQQPGAQRSFRFVVAEPRPLGHVRGSLAASRSRAGDRLLRARNDVVLAPFPTDLLG